MTYQHWATVSLVASLLAGTLFDANIHFKVLPLYATGNVLFVIAILSLIHSMRIRARDKEE